MGDEGGEVVGGGDSGEDLGADVEGVDCGGSLSDANADHRGIWVRRF